MSTALDRIVPEDKKGQGLYRHDAEGSDDMPVSLRLSEGGLRTHLGKRNVSPEKGGCVLIYE